MTGLWLTDAEIDELCAPLTQPAAQVRYLRAMLKLTVSLKPNGRALVIRSHAEAVLSGRPAEVPSIPAAKPEAEPQPNVEGFMRLIQGGRRNGASKKEQPA